MGGSPCQLSKGFTMSNFHAFIAGFTTVAIVFAAVLTLRWVILRVQEELYARRNHVCWIDDTSCADCGGHTSWSSWNKSQA